MLRTFFGSSEVVKKKEKKPAKEHFQATTASTAQTLTSPSIESSSDSESDTDISPTGTTPTTPQVSDSSVSDSSDASSFFSSSGQPSFIVGSHLIFGWRLAQYMVRVKHSSKAKHWSVKVYLKTSGSTS
ncbi:hypothetical protein L198_03050 [Cryptococcus wingfieldii CBS 7118]|uniref:Uncharacterized protein n=1 Tax=Cryptococcus wingfieldii CBS 7118 TaxID=1295528 RepID=A0A1E3JIK7_9TREE|nr:hypothetical protein L198_03050 [Cryptococcus wingfieldii CBS 7118]ODO00724.1 hypothetical protein L198_03050 [Cryptococcus wingfieldii CBS 7118]